MPRPWRYLHRNWLLLLIIFILGIASMPVAVAEQANLVHVVDAAATKMVKIFGVGGGARLEGYQTGILVSGQGHVVTSWSYVLSEDAVTVVTADGQRFDSRLVGADPRSEIALLKLEYDGDDLPHFRLSESVGLTPGCRILAFSNVFRIASGNEPVSVQHGIVSGVMPLAARSGASQFRFRGEVYVVDAITSNPGASGGALVDWRGRLAGMLGKELRGTESNTWLNYAIPVAAFVESIDAMLAGKFVAPDLANEITRSKNPLTTAALGLVLVPDVVFRTPPYVDAVHSNSVSEKAGIRPDDLVVYVEDQFVPSCREFRQTLCQIDRDMPVRIVVVRDGELMEYVLEVQDE